MICLADVAIPMTNLLTVRNGLTACHVIAPAGAEIAGLYNELIQWDGSYYAI